MTTNHPAHGPVSLDRLLQIREILSKASAQSDGGNLGYAMADAVKVIDGAIEAFGVEPVLYAAEETLAYAKMGELHLKCLSQPMGDAVIPLYTSQPAHEFPDTLPCPVHLEPGLKFGKGVRTQLLLDALRRRADYYAELEAMTSEQRTEHDSWIAGFKAMLGSEHGKSDDEIGSWNNHVNTPTAQAGNSPVAPGCSCRTCRPITFTDSRFAVCPECGNKRCPHANDHRNTCTGSNEPGHEGSAYPAAPQQEVK
ncbi:hypothetical protein [Citrobacter arsenatis]|uniref:hypothetical protein n=1 Tax=Citrobacter arsenatis TaxID=2546350 RepID=UPI001FE2E61D|nr:hypothetical protein [Citrobacter arsenatis]